jgi:uncharacterized protein
MLLDTSGLIGLFDRDEPFHVLAHDYFAASADWLTHSYILAEFVAVANARGLDRRAALAFIAHIPFSRQVTTVWVSDKLHDDGLRLLEARLDKSYSLCDAVSFVLMRRGGLTDALTTDRHFEQEGFTRLLK